MNYASLNVLNRKKDYMSDDAITEVQNMINNSGANRKQRRKIEKDLGKVENILAHCQKHVDRSSFIKYQEACDEHMRLFFALLGICMVKNYGKSEDELEELFDLLNAYLTEYQGVSTDDICKIFYEITGIQLVSE